MSSTQSFLSLALSKKKLKCERFLNEMDQVIPWYKLINEAPHPKGMGYLLC